MRKIAIAALVFMLASVGGASAGIVARVDVSKQVMTVSENGRVVARWPVSTARSGYRTPRGSWRPTRLHKMWYSRKYDNSPMPHSIFFHGGYAIHGTNYVKNLGRPASHGCVRLATANAAKFYSLVKQIGPGNTRIVVTN